MRRTDGRRDGSEEKFTHARTTTTTTRISCRIKASATECSKNGGTIHRVERGRCSSFPFSIKVMKLSPLKRSKRRGHYILYTAPRRHGHFAPSILMRKEGVKDGEGESTHHQDEREGIFPNGREGRLAAQKCYGLVMPFPPFSPPLRSPSFPSPARQKSRVWKHCLCTST